MRQVVSLLALIGLAAPVPALADKGDTATWGKVGGWSIMVDRTIGDGCFAFTVYERGTVARLGIDVQSGAFYVLVGHPEWKSLEDGKLYAVKTVFDGVKSYTGEMKGQRVGGMTFLAHRNLSSEFVKDFMQRNGVEIFFRDQRIASLSLKDSYAAFAEVLNCQKEFGFAKRTPAAIPS
jgi:hypothetical protein